MHEVQLQQEGEEEIKKRQPFLFRFLKCSL